jgi:pyridoxamine 5'-phosphate oxidase
MSNSPPASSLGQKATAAREVRYDELLKRFHSWSSEAADNGVADPTAMALATADADGNPSVRMVLLKQADEHGFAFYTNLGSPKARDLTVRPRAALCFHWAVIGRQVRVEGRTEPVSDAEADAYFASRPRLSQIGACVSRQSEPMTGSFDLEQACAAYAVRHPLGSVARPPFWSGYRVVPEVIEFWSERPFRRHERLRYVRDGGCWFESRLYP